MLVKTTENRDVDIQTLEGLLGHPQANSETRKRIEHELRCIRSGIKGEKEAAYELDFYYGDSPNWAILHDIRFEHAGRVAQIDHLVINRVLEAWVCESKRFSEGVAVNEHGEFSAFYGSKPYGMPSPIEQNRKHCDVLNDVLKSGKVAVPKRLGMSMYPSLASLVLVSKNARIGRPKVRIPGIEQIIKVDQFRAHINKNMEHMSPLLLAKAISSSTLMDLAHDLSSLHVPIQFNWAAKFGLDKAAIPSVAATTATTQEKPSGCGTPGCCKRVSPAIIRYCQTQSARFNSKVFCMDCQKQYS